MSDHDFLPPAGAIPGSADRAVPHAGTYRRVLPVSLERLYENALDWEHLPHVHADSFRSVRCRECGPWGWRACTTDGDGRESELELMLNRSCRRWITRVIAGSGTGTEIWTHAFPEGRGRVDVVVDFFVPGPSPAERARVGEAYARLYARLYDEDVAMMVERQRQLDRRLDRAPDLGRVLSLGPRQRLNLPMEIEVGGREFVLTDVDGVLAAFPRHCPHQLGPLDAAGLAGGVVTCPWHGDRFDVLTGGNLSGRACRFSHVPGIDVDEAGNVTVTASH